MSGPVEAFISALAKYSWRTLLGIFVASGVVLFFPDKLGIKSWEAASRGYLIAAFILTGVILLTHLATMTYARIEERRAERIDLRMVAGSSLHAYWNVSVEPLRKEPMLILICTMSFAHYGKYERDS